MERLDLFCESHGLVVSHDLPLARLYTKNCADCGASLRLEVVEGPSY